MIIRLSLKNFRKHESFEANFTAGLNGIFGPNYRGKSTIEYGILYALGGIRAVPCRTVLRTGASTFRVDMTFQAGDVYRIVRTKSTDRLYAGDTEDDAALLANGATVVNAKIEEIIGMSMKRFLQTRFARQKHTDAILLSGANALYAAINEISGADTVDAALKLLTERVTKLDGYLDNTVAPDVEDTQRQLKLAEAALSARIRDLQACQQKSDGSAATLRTATELLDKAAAAELENSTHEANLRHAEKDLERANAAATAVLEDGKEYADLDPESMAVDRLALKTKVDEANETYTELSRLQRDVENADRSYKNYAAAASDAEEKLSLLAAPSAPKSAKTVEEVQEVATQAATALGVVKEQLETVSSQADNACCPTCNRKWDTMTEEEISGLEERRATLTLEVKVKQAQSSAAAATLKEVKAIWETYHTARTIFDNSTTALQFQIESAKAGMKTASESLKVTEKLLTAIPELSADDRKQMDIDLQNLESRIQKCARARYDEEKAQCEVQYRIDELDALKAKEVAPYDFALHATLKRDHALLKAAHDADKEKLAEAKTDLAVVETSHGYLSKILPVQQQHLDAINAAEGKRSTAKSLQKFLKVNRDRYMADVWSVLMAEASQFASQCTSGAIECVSRTVEGDFTYTENGNEFPISEASGAQLSIMGLAMQVALSSAVQPPLDVLIVDEPNADMDPEHSMAANMLLSAAVGQVICVSHAAMDSSICQNVIEL